MLHHNTIQDKRMSFILIVDYTKDFSYLLYCIQSYEENYV